MGSTPTVALPSSTVSRTAASGFTRANGPIRLIGIQYSSNRSDSYGCIHA